MIFPVQPVCPAGSSPSGSSERPPAEVLVKEEEKEVGVVQFSVYRAYWSAVGGLLAPAILLALLLMQGKGGGGGGQRMCV